MSAIRTTEVAIVGAGQSALATAYFLKRHAIDTVLLDRESRSGGAWLHTWPSLKLFSPAQWSSLPGWGLQTTGNYPNRSDLIAYLDAYEKRYGFEIIRPCEVLAVARTSTGFDVQTRDGLQVHCRALVSAAGNWGNPFWPVYPGADLFQGVQIHSADYAGPRTFTGQKVLVVGGGNSGAQILAEISTVAQTTWVTMAEPTFLPDDVDGRVLFERATLRWKAQAEGRPVAQLPGGFADVVMVDSVKEARSRGVLFSRRPFIEFTGQGVVWADGKAESFDAVVWCTGFQPDLSHLNNLDIRNASGQVDTTDTRSNRVPGLWFVGYGDWCGFASATLIGVQRYAKATALEIATHLKP